MNGLLITVEVRSVYGLEKIYPVDEAAMRFATIARSKTLTVPVLKQIMALGYEVRYQQPHDDVFGSGGVMDRLIERDRAAVAVSLGMTGRARSLVPLSVSSPSSRRIAFVRSMRACSLPCRLLTWRSMRSWQRMAAPASIKATE